MFKTIEEAIIAHLRYANGPVLFQNLIFPVGKLMEREVTEAEVIKGILELKGKDRVEVQILVEGMSYCALTKS